MNSFHKNIKFTLEEEKDNKISFLDVLILRNGSSIETTVYRKFKHNDVFLHWDSFSPNSWKVGTLKTLLLRAFVVCSNEQLLNREIEHLRNVFHHTNGHPKAVIQNVISKVKEEQSTPFVNITGSHRDDVSKSYLLTLPCKGKSGEKTLRSITKEVNKILPDKQKATLDYTSTKLGSNFNIKDTITKKGHKHDLVYSVKCPEETCNKTYNGETGRRLVKRIDEHRGKDKNLHVYQHSMNSNHALVTLDGFTVLNSGYKHSKFKRNISEALFINSNRDLTLTSKIHQFP